ncbi:interferon gamma-like [Bufo gargarizans]|uniref:interferon gamma-like n=1 Tax=Bufo gargarizans TaxID=30331 RepID=UPI001CF25C44|nr:interferon gamma-like [Bufo gargarizans]
MMTYFKIFLLHCAVLCYIGQINGYNINLKIARDDIEKLRKYLQQNLKDTNDTEDTDIFSKLLDDWKEEGEKKLLLSQIVPMYLKMLDSMKASEVNDSITNLTQMLYTSNKDYLEKTDQKMKRLNELKKLQMSDIKIQRAAIKELLRVLRDVSTLQGEQKPGSNKCKRENIRRRRGC